MEKRNKISMVFNTLSLYRKAIYKMIDEGYDCDWYIEDADAGVKTFEKKELKSVTMLPIINLGAFYWEKGLLKLLRKPYDVYFMMGATRNLSLFIFCILKRLLYPNKRIYYWTHGIYGKESWLELTFWKRPLLKMADALFIYGDYARNKMIEEGFDSEKIYAIHNSLDYDRQIEIRRNIKETKIYREHFANENPVIIFLGRLTAIKRLDILVDALVLLREEGQICNLIFVGDGKERDTLEKKVKEGGIEKNTWFYGECFDEKTNAELLYNADLCVAPGNIGLTAIHALTFGCPAVSHNNFSMQMPEFESIIPDKTGDFFDYNRADSLAETINKWLIHHKNDRECVRKNCYNEIDKNWNPNYQMALIREHLL